MRKKDIYIMVQNVWRAGINRVRSVWWKVRKYPEGVRPGDIHWFEDRNKFARECNNIRVMAALTSHQWQLTDAGDVDLGAWYDADRAEGGAECVKCGFRLGMFHFAQKRGPIYLRCGR